MDWLPHITHYTKQLADTADAADLSAPVPTCPSWTLADLTWHLLEVQDFWTWIITNRPAGPQDYPEPVRPPDDQLADGLRSQCAALVDALGAADPADEAWSWTDDHTVGFSYRRQAHEAFVHLADACVAAGAPLPEASPEFGADGVDELISNNLAPIPDWGSFTPGHDRLIALETTDTSSSWTLRFGTFGGTSPNTGATYDGEPQVQLAEGPATTTVRAEAASLDLWLWGRAEADAVNIEGDTTLATDLRAIISGETQ